MRTVWAFFLCLMLGSIDSLSAQEADEKFGRLINAQDWFGLNQAYACDSANASPYIRLFTKAMLSHFFNRPADAVSAIDSLLTSHQRRLSSSIFSMISLRSSNMMKLGKYAGNADFMERVCEQLGRQGQYPQLASFRSDARNSRSLSRYEMSEWKRPDADVVVPMTIKSVGEEGKQITIPLSLNGHDYNAVFDTGAGVNVVSPEIAESCQMEMFGDTMIVTGTRETKGVMALAHELTIGNLHLKNVPFYVVDMSTGNLAADRWMGQLAIVIGEDILNILNEVRLDFANGQLIVPSKETPAPSFAPNMAYSTGGTLIMSCADIYGKPWVGQLDTGAGQSHLYYPLFERDSLQIKSHGLLGRRRHAGLGGIIEDVVYRLPQYQFSAAGRGITLQNVFVDGEPPRGRTAQWLGGNLGMDFFLDFKNVVINMRQMFILFEK